MSDGIVIDANIIPKFCQELRRDGGPVYELVTQLCDLCGIATCDQIEIEWEDVCSDVWFLEWYTDALKNGFVRKIELKPLSSQIKKKMRNDYGFPDDDVIYVRCARSTEKTKYIMTENYHFYDPKCLAQSAQAKQRAREKREGRFCRFLLEQFGIHVGTPEQCRDDFSQGQTDLVSAESPLAT